MKAFFAVGAGTVAVRMLAEHNALVSFAMIGTSWVSMDNVRALRAVCPQLFLDSGAFSAWNKGAPIDLAAYVAFVREYHAIFDVVAALDVIGDGPASLNNWIAMMYALPELADKIMPVFHEGDDVALLDQYVAGGGNVGLGRTAGRRNEDKTFEFYDLAFNRYPLARFHAFGNSNPKTLEPYPFHSFDSTTWERDSAYGAAQRWPWSHASKATRMAAYIEATETIHHKPAAQMRLAV